MRLAWLVVPSTKTVHVFKPPHPPRLVQGFDSLLGSGPVLPGFVLELRQA